MASAVVLASGGINSTVAACLVAREVKINLLYADYGWPASACERAAVQALAAAVKADRVVDLELGHFAQIEQAVRSARSETPGTAAAGPPATDASSATDGSTEADMPGLMPTLLLAGVHWAARIGAGRVVCGASQITDETDGQAAPDEGRPDRRAEFFHVFNMALESALPRHRCIRVETPLIDMSREEIVRLGTRFDAPFDRSWSCHRAGEAPCGGCPGCRARDSAFTAAALVDPAAAPAPRR